MAHRCSAADGCHKTSKDFGDLATREAVFEAPNSIWIRLQIGNVDPRLTNRLESWRNAALRIVLFMHKIDSVTILKNQISFDKNIFEAKMYANLLKHVLSKM